MKIKTFKPAYVKVGDEIEVPELDAKIDELIDFALSFNGYEYAGGLVELAGSEQSLWDRTCHKVNAGKLDEVSIEDLRACLFWVQRSDRHAWTSNDNFVWNTEEYIDFVRLIRQKLSI